MLWSPFSFARAKAARASRAREKGDHNMGAARLEIRSSDRTPRRARAVRAKCSLAGLTNPQNTNIMIFNFIFPLACDLVLATCACSSRKIQRIVDVLRPSIKI